VQNRYLAGRLDLTDAINVSLAERYETVAVLTLDRRDFRAISPLTGDAAFRLLPDDL
jgi:predicted nucleic acid-binding protein